MIERPTVLVLGAGASAGFGFPPGLALLRRVVDELDREDGATSIVLRALGHPPDQIQEFRRALVESRVPSVDALLESRNEFVGIGKAAIACGLVPYEKHGRLFAPDTWSWYDHLLGRLTDTNKVEDFRGNRLSVVTFNYDRSLEHFLYTSLRHRWKLTPESCVELLRAIHVVHVYGQLGKLPELDGEGRPYETAVTTENVRQCAAEIQIIHEAASLSPPLEYARELLRNADVICFLGFGYHAVNLARLGLNNQPRVKEIMGSAYHLLEGEQAMVRKSFEPTGLRIWLGDEGEDVLTFLRNREVLV